MTAIVMIFEMTRDYDIIVPVIVAVAVAAGVRRALIGETIYTIKLRHRGHRIPKERHVNLYLAQQAQDIMERRFILAKAGIFPQGSARRGDRRGFPRHRRRARRRVVGLVPPRSGLWMESIKNPDISIDQFVESKIVVVRDVDILSLVFARLKRIARAPPSSSAARIGRESATSSRDHQTRDRRCGDRQFRRMIASLEDLGNVSK